MRLILSLLWLLGVFNARSQCPRPPSTPSCDGGGKGSLAAGACTDCPSTPATKCKLEYRYTNDKSNTSAWTDWVTAGGGERVKVEVDCTPGKTIRIEAKCVKTDQVCSHSELAHGECVCA